MIEKIGHELKRLAQVLDGKGTPGRQSKTRLLHPAEDGDAKVLQQSLDEVQAAAASCRIAMSGLQPQLSASWEPLPSPEEAPSYRLPPPACLGPVEALSCSGDEYAARDARTRLQSGSPAFANLGMRRLPPQPASLACAVDGPSTSYSSSSAVPRAGYLLQKGTVLPPPPGRTSTGAGQLLYAPTPSSVPASRSSRWQAPPAPPAPEPPALVASGQGERVPGQIRRVGTMPSAPVKLESYDPGQHLIAEEEDHRGPARGHVSWAPGYAAEDERGRLYRSPRRYDQPEILQRQRSAARMQDRQRDLSSDQLFRWSSRGEEETADTAGYASSDFCHAASFCGSRYASKSGACRASPWKPGAKEKELQLRSRRSEQGLSSFDSTGGRMPLPADLQSCSQPCLNWAKDANTLATPRTSEKPSAWRRQEPDFESFMEGQGAGRVTLSSEPHRPLQSPAELPWEAQTLHAAEAASIPMPSFRRAPGAVKAQKDLASTLDETIEVKLPAGVEDVLAAAAAGPGALQAALAAAARAAVSPPERTFRRPADTPEPPWSNEAWNWKDKSLEKSLSELNDSSASVLAGVKDPGPGQLPSFDLDREEQTGNDGHDSHHSSERHRHDLQEDGHTRNEEHVQHNRHDEPHSHHSHKLRDHRHNRGESQAAQPREQHKEGRGKTKHTPPNDEHPDNDDPNDTPFQLRNESDAEIPDQMQQESRGVPRDTSDNLEQGDAGTKVHNEQDLEENQDKGEAAHQLQDPQEVEEKADDDRSERRRRRRRHHEDDGESRGSRRSSRSHIDGGSRRSSRQNSRSGELGEESLKEAAELLQHGQGEEESAGRHRERRRSHHHDASEQQEDHSNPPSSSGRGRRHHHHHHEDKEETASVSDRSQRSHRRRSRRSENQAAETTVELPKAAVEASRLEGIKEESNAGSSPVRRENVEFSSRKPVEHEHSAAPEAEVEKDAEEDRRRAERRAARRKEREEREEPRSRQSHAPSEVSEVPSSKDDEEAQQRRHNRRESRRQERQEREDEERLAKEEVLAAQHGSNKVADAAIQRPAKDYEKDQESGSSTATPSTATPSSPGNKGNGAQLDQSQSSVKMWKPDTKEKKAPQEEELVRGAERRWQEEIDSLKRQAQRSSRSERTSVSNIPSRYQANRIPDDAVE